MLIKTFDNGWGPQFAVKQLEQRLIDQYIKTLAINGQKVVVINSTWYTDEYHMSVVEWLRNNKVDIVVLVAMIDAAIPTVEIFKEFEVEVFCVGYYPGPNQIDFWAIFLEQYYCHSPDLDVSKLYHVDRPFMCLNRKPHWHRQRLFKEFQHYNLINLGLVSMGSDTGTPLAILDMPIVPDLAPNTGIDQYGIPNDISSLGNFQNWQRHFLNIVTETVYGINNTHFVSEKIYKPIVGMRPFLVYDPDGACKWLSDRGFENFTNDFADITDLDLKNPHNISPFLVNLSNQPRSYWQHKLVDLQQKIMYNKEHFYQYVDQQKLKVQKGILCLT